MQSTNQKKKQYTVWGIILNFFLFLIKLIAGILSGSVAILSDALNSLGDIISSCGIYYAVHISSLPADKKHPFGHNRAEPIAGFVVAILTGILGVEVILNAIRSLFDSTKIHITPLILIFIIGTIVIKIVMTIVYFKAGKKHLSPALTAIGVDSRNDIFLSLIVLAGVIGSYSGLLYIESIIALGIAGMLLYSAFDLGKNNIDYLMGISPNKHFEQEVKRIIQPFEKKAKLRRMRAHYIGTTIQLEIELLISASLSLQQAHDIGKEIRIALEMQPLIENVFVHIQPQN